MEGHWTIVDHHLALDVNGCLIHPSAEEIYSAFSGGKIQNTICPNPQVDLPNLKFSKFGTEMSIDLNNGDNGTIQIDIYAERRGSIVPVDFVDGKLIDHCVTNNSWFYLTGNITEAQTLLTECEVESPGQISTRQYLKLVEHDLLSDHCLFKNNVSIDALKAPVDESENTPDTLKASLFPYQKTGYLWLKYMLEETRGCILGDEMGLGKTIQVITELLHLKAEGILPAIIIAPISLLTNWERECDKFAPSLNTFIHHGNNRTGNYRDLLQYDVVITSYTTVVSDLYMLNMIKWELVVLDEAQSVKNPLSARTKACKFLNRNRSLAVSGTPFENHVTDIWSLVDFIQPGLLGSLSKYNEIISDDSEGGKRIEPILSPLMIRRLVKDVAKDLPEKVVSAIPLQMSEKECEQYDQYRNDLLREYDADKITLGMLQMLRIYCTHPYAAQKMPHAGNPSDVSVKYQRFCEIVEEILSRNEKVIVFTSYKMMFDIFQYDVPSRFGIPIWSINGETPVEDRQKIVDIFNVSPGAAMLILNPRAAGTGLNITGANHVIHFNLEWNPSLEDQSTARAYRRGQQKTVFVYRLYYEGTIEEVVNDRINRKRDIAATAVIGTDGTNQDREDIIRALSLVPSFKK
jgi:SNF2 family DNA or RNA helicase